MWRTVLFLLLAPLASASDYLKYLDPVVLQTYTSPQNQTIAASEIIRKYTDKFTVNVDPKLFQYNKDTFHLRVADGILHINASTGVAAVWGFNYYLKKYCKSQIAWQTTNVRIPDPLPSIEGTETVVANDRFRYYQNVCTASYSFAWWYMDEWDEHVDWMALNGINLALAPIAQEAAWSRVYKRLGMSQEEIDMHFTGPAFLSWLRMGNVHGWAGPIPQSWHDRQRDIQIMVVERMTRLGMVLVWPAFNGHVPKAFSRIYPNSTIHKVGQWNHFEDQYCCGSFLDPIDPMFTAIGQMFNEESFKGFDNIEFNAHIYTADPFNEVKVEHFSTALVEDTARAIFSVINKFDDKAVWLLQNWMFVSDPLMWPIDRVKSLLTSLPPGRMLVLDLQAEQWPQYDLYDMYYGQPFIWCMLHNFGGTLGMFGNMVTINRDVYEVRSRAKSTMIGIGLTPEGINQNYVVYDLMLESAWRDRPVQDMEAWAAEYAERRYGCDSTAEAWKYLLKSVYSFDGLNRIRGKYVVTRRPSFRIKPWAWYRSYDLFKAFEKLIFNGNNCTAEGYYYDVVDVTRQALQYRAEQIYVNVVNDRFTNLFVFKDSVAKFLDVFSDMSDILSENEYFHGIEWFEKADKFGANDDERRFYQMNARNQVTLWGPNGEISDYACKQWAHLFKDYYRPRWAMFLTAAVQAKVANEVFDEKATRRVVTDDVEIPFMDVYTSNILSPIYDNDSLLKTSKRLYRKWVHLPSVEDLPVIVIQRNPDGRTTLADVEVANSVTPDPPSVVTSPTTMGN